MISILIPVYNGIEFIELAIQSVLKQTYAEWEILIGVNGHPPESTVYQTAKAYEAQDPRIHAFDQHTLRGKVAAMNDLVGRASYDWIAVLDVDDFWAPGKLAAQVPWLSAGYDVVGTACRYFGDLRGSPAIPVGDLSGVDFCAGNPIINSSALIRRELAVWSPDAPHGLDDYDMWLRLWRGGRRFFNVAEHLTFHRVHRSSAFNATGNSNKVPELLARYK